MEQLAQRLAASSLSPQGWSAISEACAQLTGDASIGQGTGSLDIDANGYELLSKACSTYIEQFGDDDAKRQLRSVSAPMDTTSTTPASQATASKPHITFTTLPSSSTIVPTSNTPHAYNYFAHSIPACPNHSPPTTSNPYPTARSYYRASAFYPVSSGDKVPAPPVDRLTFQNFSRTPQVYDAPEPRLIASETESHPASGTVTTKSQASHKRFNPYSRPAPASNLQAPTLPKFRSTGTNVLFDNADDTFRPTPYARRRR
ncbi:hypothetical protein BDZ89DRAFT_1064391 [Hymenopellis radicata]|nr:hypothetical protein BDZ89DRAFT_1064391 [Hymenopellis radicata]